MAVRYGGPWRRLRLEVLAEARGICALCGKPGADSVDHIVPLIERPDLELDRSNLQAAHIGWNSAKEIRRRHRPDRRKW